ncbi:hypothetical protein BDN71DRAFT_1512667 [Pleurotus eryngii]|uniref:Uncharacterized protein n=1 Tax=Pleurotus eryngii TaxID=5323 RepID=A0A9P5ZK51_PLEER|nr:hypothetical protein BDN71DRAFT_1512667 [Pleurotus eryngii]
MSDMQHQLLGAVWEHVARHPPGFGAYSYPCTQRRKKGMYIDVLIPQSPNSLSVHCEGRHSTIPGAPIAHRTLEASERRREPRAPPGGRPTPSAWFVSRWTGYQRTLGIGYPSMGTDVAVVNDIKCVLDPVSDDYLTAQENTIRCGVPLSQFLDEYPEPEAQLIRHRASNQGDDRLCYLTLDFSIYTRRCAFIRRIYQSATNSPPISPLHSNAFQSLNNIHLNFLLSTQDDCRNNNPSSQNSLGTLSFTVEASSIHSLTGTNSVACGNSITIASEHRNVQVNLAGLHGVNININFISGDSYFGAISSSNIGRMNNVNTSAYLIVTLET